TCVLIVNDITSVVVHRVLERRCVCCHVIVYAINSALRLATAVLKLISEVGNLCLNTIESVAKSHVCAMETAVYCVIQRISDVTNYLLYCIYFASDVIYGKSFIDVSSGSLSLKAISASSAGSTEFTVTSNSSPAKSKKK